MFADDFQLGICLVNGKSPNAVAVRGFGNNIGYSDLRAGSVVGPEWTERDQAGTSRICRRPQARERYLRARLLAIRDRAEKL